MGTCKLLLGCLFLAVHPTIFTWRPRYDSNEIAVWSWWWLWFEASWCRRGAV